MGKKLFVGSLANTVTEEQLRAKLEAFGDVDELNVIYDRETGRSRGFAFATFFNDSEADEAISALDGEEFEGSRLSVNEARPSTDRPRSNFKPRQNNRPYSKGGGNKRRNKGRGRY